MLEPGFLWAWNEKMIDLVRNLVKSYALQKECIILLAIPMTGKDLSYVAEFEMISATKKGAKLRENAIPTVPVQLVPPMRGRFG